MLSSSFTNPTQDYFSSPLFAVTFFQAIKNGQFLTFLALLLAERHSDPKNLFFFL